MASNKPVVRRASPRRSVRSNKAPAWVVALNEKIDALTANVARLLLVLQPRDGVDERLLEAIADTVGGRETTFTTRELVRHAEFETSLRAALDAADVCKPTEIGWLLRRHENALVDGIKVERELKQAHAGVLWRVYRLSSEKLGPKDT
jgi:hypothetical protein